jgi:hypothetical protein
VPHVTIENPILNSAFEAPRRHFRFDNDGITSDVEEKRRASAFFMPIFFARHASSTGMTCKVERAQPEGRACSVPVTFDI